MMSISDMNRQSIFGLILASFLIVGGLLYAFTHESKKSESVEHSHVDHSQHKHAIEACDLFKLEDAQITLGQNAQQINQKETVGDENMHITECNFVAPNDDVNATRSIRIVAEYPLTREGRTINQRAFKDDAIPTGSQSVENLGGDAYWTQISGTLTMIKGGVIVKVSYGTPLPADHKLEDNRQVAQLILNKL
jgi:hypothetical protein